MIRSKILGVGSYLPEKIWTNDDLAQMMDTSDEWITQRTGIKQRHWVDVDSHTTTSDLALEAVTKALTSSKVDKNEIECIVFATLTGDHFFPGSGCFLQEKLGVPGIPAIDIRQQCTGFIYAVAIADQFIRTGMYNKILVVGAEVHSKGLKRSPEGRDVGVLFGDGAGAVVLGKTEVTDPDKDSYILSSHLHADGRFAKELWVSAPGMYHKGDQISHELLDQNLQYPYMNGKAVFINAVKKMPEVTLEALNFNNKKPDDVDLYLFHQANLRINEAAAQQLNIPHEKVFNTIQKFGNTTAATIPLGMDEAVKLGKLKPGMLVACAAFGSGFTWGSTLLRW